MQNYISQQIIPLVYFLAQKLSTYVVKFTGYLNQSF